MSHQRVAFRRDGNNMMYQDVHERRGEDGYHVRITETEWLPNTIETPGYPDLGYFFNDNSSTYEGFHGDGYDKHGSRRQAENAHVKKHHVHYEPVGENVRVQKHHVRYEPDMEKVNVKKHHAQYEPVNEGKRQTYEKDVDIEADDFIKRKHRALDLSKLMSMKTYN